ncbi:hypothetical protein FDECE_9500 [Fusarium decemcellulare]|nr:hypothetical protein FDECE_9500 [Fusarium decemcellulare]
MLVLPCLDAVDQGDEADDDQASVNPASKSSQPSSYGVHYETVLVACQIITGNSFDNAYLSYDRPGNDRVGMNLDGILTKSDYYLHVVQDVGGDSKSYAVTPNFQQWRFPDQLPDNWRSLQSTHLDPHQRSCIISGSQKTEDAHVVPRAQDEWYEANGMRHYSLGGRSVSDSEDNSCRMRPDLHRIFDDRAFALIPKPDGHGQ